MLWLASLRALSLAPFFPSVPIYTRLLCKSVSQPSCLSLPEVNTPFNQDLFIKLSNLLTSPGTLCSRFWQPWEVKELKYKYTYNDIQIKAQIKEGDQEALSEILLSLPLQVMQWRAAEKDFSKRSFGSLRTREMVCMETFFFQQHTICRVGSKLDYWQKIR